MNDQIVFDINSVYNTIQISESKKETENVVVDVMVFVAWLDFIRVKYGVDSLVKLHNHDELGIITSQWTSAKEIESRLRTQNQLTDQIDEDMVMRIKASKTYVDYTNESGTIVLTIEKLFQVCARMFKDFKLGKKNFVTVVSYFWESREIVDQPIQQLITFVQEIYALRNKKMVMEGNVTTYHEITWALLVKKYGKDTLPVHMNRLWLQMKGSCDMFVVPEYMSNTASIQILVSALVDTDSKKVEIDPFTKSFVRVDVSLGTSIVHEYDRQISKQLTILPETISMVDTLVDLKVVPKEDHEDLIKYFYSTAIEVDGKLKAESVDLDYSVLNVGWLTVPKNPKNNIETAQRDFANVLLNKLHTEEHFYVYCPITYDYIKLRHPAGIKIPNAQFLLSILRALTKFFHFMNQICSFYKKEPDRIRDLVFQMIDMFAYNFSPQTSSRSRFNMLFKMNYKVWVRAVEITEFGQIRDVYLPSPTMGYNEVYEELKEDIVIDL